MWSTKPLWRRPSRQSRFLPFANLSQKPDTDYFPCALAEDVTRLLVRNWWPGVLIRHSAVVSVSRNTDGREIGTGSC
jgi:TolB-like protein